MSKYGSSSSLVRGLDSTISRPSGAMTSSPSRIVSPRPTASTTYDGRSAAGHELGERMRADIEQRVDATRGRGRERAADRSAAVTEKAPASRHSCAARLPTMPSPITSACSPKRIGESSWGVSAMPTILRNTGALVGELVGERDHRGSVLAA